MDVKLATYTTFRDRIQNLMLCGGVRPYEGKFHLCRIIAFYGIFMLVTLVGKISLICVANIKNILMVTQSVSLIFSLSTLFLKIIVCMVYREDMLMLEKNLGGKFEKELKKEENRPILLERITVYTKLMYILALLLFPSLFIPTTLPILMAIKGNNYIYIYLGNYPFPVTGGSPLYWMMYAFELTASYFFVTVMNGVDNAFGLHSFQICGLLRLAGRRLIDIQPDDPNYKAQLRECMEMHQLVLKAKDALQRAYGLVVIWINITNSIIMCTVMWQANQLKNIITISKALYFLCFVTLKLVQSFNYAYYGSLVSRENDNYQNLIYMSNWPGSGNVQLMKDMLFILTQRTIAIKACGYFFITMEMFEKIVNTTISYFFLLQTIDAKK